MKITILTLFPESFEGFLQGPVLRRAIRNGALAIEVVDIRNYADGSFRKLDDNTFGGGVGQVMRAKPVLSALAAVRQKDSVVCAMTPVGVPYTQKMARELSGLSHLILLCGHYEGIDERVYKAVDRRICLGDFVLTGGEIAACAVADSVIRLLPGVLKEDATRGESFENGLLEYPQYTQPADLDGDLVPPVLLSGDHEKIRKWRLEESLRATLRYRPDLLRDRPCTPEEQAILDRIRKEKPGERQ